jgi:hypothetical protein
VHPWAVVGQEHPPRRLDIRVRHGTPTRRRLSGPGNAGNTALTHALLPVPRWLVSAPLARDQLTLVIQRRPMLDKVIKIIDRPTADDPAVRA